MKYEKGKIVTGQVTGIEKYGIFVSLDEFYSGLIHISEISDGFVKNVSEYVNVGETIHVKVMEIDDENYHLKLSIKDINYKIRKRNFSPLKETKLGFKPFEKELPRWIDKKINELRKS